MVWAYLTLRKFDSNSLVNLNIIEISMEISWDIPNLVYVTIDFIMWKSISEALALYYLYSFCLICSPIILFGLNLPFYILGLLCTPIYKESFILLQMEMEDQNHLS